MRSHITATIFTRDRRKIFGSCYCNWASNRSTTIWTIFIFCCCVYLSNVICNSLVMSDSNDLFETFLERCISVCQPTLQFFWTVPWYLTTDQQMKRSDCSPNCCSSMIHCDVKNCLHVNYSLRTQNVVFLNFQQYSSFHIFSSNSETSDCEQLLHNFFGV